MPNSFQHSQGQLKPGFDWSLQPGNTVGQRHGKG